MTEREKMLAGELYLGMDPELVASRLRTRRVLREYNDSDPMDAEGRRAILGRLIGKLGANVWIEPPFQCDYGDYIELGDGVYMNFGCVVLDCNVVRIGAGTMLGPSVQIYAATHPLSAAERKKGPELTRPVTIGSDVWIGGGAIICPGVTIGDSATIGAGAVVTRDVPPQVFAAGNPARVIREVGP